MDVTGQVTAMDHMVNGGLWAGIEGVDNYRIRLRGLSRYATESSRIQPTQDASAPRDKLAAAVQQTIQSGHLAPYRMLYGKFESHEVYYYTNPAELHVALNMAMPLLPADLQTQAKAYMSAEAKAFSPLNTDAMPYDQGARRELYTVPKGIRGTRPSTSPPLFNLYGAWAYADATGDWDYVRDNWTNVTAILNKELMRPFDWAMGFYARERGRTQGVAEVNQAIAGVIGYIRMADHLAKPAERDYGIYLLNRLLLTRYALSKFIFATYDTKLRVIPAIAIGSQIGGWVIDDARCDPDPRALNWTFQLNMMDFENTQPRRRVWVDASTDLGQATQFDEWDVKLLSAGKNYPYQDDRLPALEWITPEVGAFLADTCRDDIQRYMDGLTELWPDWPCVMREEISPTEAAVFGPEVPWSMFCAESLVLGADRATVQSHLDIPLCVGDLYQIQKLAIAAGQFQRPTGTPQVSRNILATAPHPLPPRSTAPPTTLPLPPDTIERYAPPTIFSIEPYVDYRRVRIDFTKWSDDRILYVLRTPATPNQEGAMCEATRRDIRAVIPDLVRRVDAAQPGPWNGTAITAMRCLAHMKAAEAVPVVIKKLDPTLHLRIRAEAARTLGFLAGEESKKALQDCLAKETEPVVRFCAAVALSQHDLSLARKELETFATGPDPLLARYASSWLSQQERKP